ncbi:flavodoxin family protein [Pseudovibrio denitrificans]|uniref:flavodoxin family protein n=1 Tax=Pseudovibrio denitrificans TaxID=258256 RepID=UPI000AE559FF|nr:flavodoxin family protein [Pseudovibrio denitrificans]
MSKDILVAIAFFSANGHTETLAHAIARGARENGVTVTFVPVSEYEDTDWGTLEAADAIVFGTPTYMGGVAAPFKFFMDASATVWYKQGWINKIAGGFSVSGSMSGDRLNVFLQMATFAAQHGMIWVSLACLPATITASAAMTISTASACTMALLRRPTWMKGRRSLHRSRTVTQLSLMAPVLPKQRVAGWKVVTINLSKAKVSLPCTDDML